MRTRNILSSAILAFGLVACGSTATTADEASVGFDANAKNCATECSAEKKAACEAAAKECSEKAKTECSETAKECPSTGATN